METFKQLTSEELSMVEGGRSIIKIGQKILNEIGKGFSRGWNGKK